MQWPWRSAQERFETDNLATHSVENRLEHDCYISTVDDVVNVGHEAGPGGCNAFRSGFPRRRIVRCRRRDAWRKSGSAQPQTRTVRLLTGRVRRPWSSLLRSVGRRRPPTPPFYAHATASYRGRVLFRVDVPV